MHYFSEEIRESVWEQLVTQKPKPPMLTVPRLKKLKVQVWDNEDFWSDILDRHGLRHEKLDDLEKDVKEHAIGNFWGMLCQMQTIGRV